MNNNKQTPNQVAPTPAACGEFQEDDGVDPRTMQRPSRSRSRESRKTRQLCHQVRRTLELVLQGEFSDARLHNLQVLSVEPAPNCSQLAVTVATDQVTSGAELAEIGRRLDAVSGHLRSEVAAAIHRKRTPRLLFRVVCGPN